jgi:hypothetical protein
MHAAAGMQKGAGGAALDSARRRIDRPDRASWMV